MNNNINFQTIRKNVTKMDLIQTNKFSYFSNDSTIFFSKIDLINQTLDQIRLVKNNCVLIVGNGDLPFTDELESCVPYNVNKIFAQNNISSSERVISLPLGIGNSEPCGKSGHGEYWDDVKEKVKILSGIEKTEIKNFEIYCNFRDYTHPTHRRVIKEICKNINYVKVDHSNLPYDEFISKILKSSCVICPAGNGLDTHRLWETLYCYRIPITFRVKNTRSYHLNNDQIGLYDDLYEKLPIIILNNENDISNKSLILNKLKEANMKWKNIELLDFSFWKEKINNEIKK